MLYPHHWTYECTHHHHQHVQGGCESKTVYSQGAVRVSTHIHHSLSSVSTDSKYNVCVYLRLITAWSEECNYTVNHYRREGPPNLSLIDLAKDRFGGKFASDQVDDVKKLWRICKVFCLLIPYWICYSQVLLRDVLLPSLPPSLSLWFLVISGSGSDTSSKMKKWLQQMSAHWTATIHRISLLSLTDGWQPLLAPGTTNGSKK